MFDNLYGNFGGGFVSQIIQLHSQKCTVIKLCERENVSGYNRGQWSPFTSALTQNLILVHFGHANISS